MKISEPDDLAGTASYTEAWDVRKSYGPISALSGVSLRVQPGELVTLLGPNGAGKTTLVRCILGLERPDGGNVRVFGADPAVATSRRNVGVMLQIARVPGTLTVEEHIDLFSSYYPSPFSIAETVRRSNLAGLENRLFKDLSGGEQQRLLFALAICGNPRLLILDEPTTGLDVETRRTVWDELKRFTKEGKSVLLTTHYLEEADALSNRIVILDHGRVIAQGTSGELKSRIAMKTVRCVTSLTVTDLENVAGISEVRQGWERTEFHCTDSDHVIGEIYRLDPKLSRLEIVSAQLEDVFLDLTRSSSNNGKE